MLITPSPHPSYQVGGSLPFNAPTYVRRQADEALFHGLLRGEFCYVFNARQMGKSSLRVQTTRRLQAEGVRCAVIDITTIGTQEITPEQWYASIAGLLTKTLQLSVNLRLWWQERSHLSVVNRLSDFFDTVVLPQIPESIVIFIDEIDSVLSLKFSTDDFFALIRACYNRRAEQSDYHRLTFALFGVATPADLISDATRTPFNIGQAIELRGFQHSEATPLLFGLADAIPNPELTLQRILYWTGGQPFLTQKLCQLAANSGAIEPWRNQECPTQFVYRLVQTHILNNWEAQDEPEHLKTIRDRMLLSESRASRLLGLYQRILLRSPLDSSVESDETGGTSTSDSQTQTELLLSGLVEKQGNGLRVKNPIYQTVFGLDWVAEQLALLRPYAQSLNAWIASGYQDESRLLRGQALRDVLHWSQDKSLADLDYRFLSASQEWERREEQARSEAERVKEVEARLELARHREREQRKSLRQQRILLGIVTAIMVIAMALGAVAYQQYRQTAFSELKAIALSSEALYASNKEFDALLQAIKGKQRLQHLSGVDANLKAKVDAALQRVVLSIQEHNRLNGHTTAVLTVDFSPDGQQIATASVDGSLKLWKPDGSLIKTWKAHPTVIRVVKFSPDGELLASTGDDHIIKLWKRDGTLLHTLSTHTAGIWSLDFSPDSSTLIASGSGSKVEMWSREGRLVKTLEGQAAAIRDVAFSPDGQTIAAACAEQIKVWNTDGTLRLTLKGHEAPVQAVTYSPDGNILVSGSADATIKLWSREGTLLTTLRGHDATIWKLAFSPDGKMFASSSWDKTIKLWSRDGTLLTTLRGHNASVWGVAFSPDGSAIASAGADSITIVWKSQSVFQKSLQGVTGTTRRLVFNPEGTTFAVAGTDKTIKLWTLDGVLLRTINAHDAAVFDIDWSPDGNAIASASEDNTVKLWKPDGALLQTLKGHSAAVLSVAWNPDSRVIAAGGVDGNILLWQRDGTLLKTLKGHQASVWDIQFSPDGQRLASGSNDGTIRLWNRDGKLLKTLNGHQAAVWTVMFSPDGKRLASGSGDRTVKLWTPDGTLLKTLTGHTAAIWGIAFSPDGSLMATASVDETVKLWKQDGTLLTTLKGHRAGVRNVIFHPHRPILASAGDDQTLVLWNLQQILHLDPLTYACNWVRDYLRTNVDVGNEDSQLCQHILNSEQ
ncbi:MAG TPA: AAA-like domain-containing protein [Allocoleopsis sp.]